MVTTAGRPSARYSQPAARYSVASSACRASTIRRTATSSPSTSRVGLAELVPLGQQHHDVGAAERLLEAVDVVEVRIDAVCVLVGLRVVDNDRRALEVEQSGHIEGRGVPDVVGVGLECRSERRDPLSLQLAADQLPGEVDRARTAAQVDLVHLVEERDGLADAELFGAGPEGTDVLRQAAAAESETGLQEAAADPVVEARARPRAGSRRRRSPRRPRPSR